MIMKGRDGGDLFPRPRRSWTFCDDALTLIIGSVLAARGMNILTIVSLKREEEQ